MAGQSLAERTSLPAYDDEAEHYDDRTSSFQAWRDQVVDEMPIEYGDRVVDVGCGTGLCFERIEASIGRAGQIFGIDESEPMLELARRRSRENGWSNVTLVHAPAAAARLPAVGDAAVFCAVHDVLQDASALTTVLSQLREGAWVGGIGGQWAHPLLVAYNALIYGLHAPYVRDFRGFERPWALLARYLEEVRVDEIAWGSGYRIVGRARSDVATRSWEGEAS
jgi:demethylmenaquinone methyltransferase/2-methoxy-6-polyprenyl-1,4-benzoquinol methylase